MAVLSINHRIRHKWETLRAKLSFPLYLCEAKEILKI